jgi:hypothetical protein
MRMLGKCEEEGTKSVAFDSGAVIRRVVVTMQPMGIVGLQIATSSMTSPHIFFATNIQSLKHITHFSVFLSRESAGIQGFQTHFDDREPIPKHIAWYGKGVPMLIDGAAGERLYKIKASWSNAK